MCSWLRLNWASVIRDGEIYFVGKVWSLKQWYYIYLFQAVLPRIIYNIFLCSTQVAQLWL